VQLSPLGTVILAQALLLGAGSVAAHAAEPGDWKDLRLVATSPASGTAVVESPEGRLAVVRTGESLVPGGPRVHRVRTDRLVLEDSLDGEDGKAARRVRYWMFRAKEPDLPSRVVLLSRIPPPPPLRQEPRMVPPARGPPEGAPPGGVR
jgi:hypothetical protein